MKKTIKTKVEHMINPGIIFATIKGVAKSMNIALTPATSFRNMHRVGRRVANIFGISLVMAVSMIFYACENATQQAYDPNNNGTNNGADKDPGTGNGGNGGTPGTGTPGNGGNGGTGGGTPGTGTPGTGTPGTGTPDNGVDNGGGDNGSGTPGTGTPDNGAAFSRSHTIPMTFLCASAQPGEYHTNDWEFTLENRVGDDVHDALVAKFKQVVELQIENMSIISSTRRAFQNVLARGLTVVVRNDGDFDPRIPSLEENFTWNRMYYHIDFISGRSAEDFRSHFAGMVTQQVVNREPPQAAMIKEMNDSRLGRREGRRREGASHEKPVAQVHTRVHYL